MALRWFSDYCNQRILSTNQLTCSQLAGTHFFSVFVSLIDSLWDNNSTYLSIILNISVFMTEALIKILGLGAHRYFKSGWNLFDFHTSLLMLLAAFGLNLFPSEHLLVVFRPLRMLRVFKIKKRYRDVFGTLVIISPLMLSTLIVMLVLYYFFAIIGMELFSGYDMKNCCQ